MTEMINSLQLSIADFSRWKKELVILKTSKLGLPVLKSRKIKNTEQTSETARTASSAAAYIMRTLEGEEQGQKGCLKK